MDDEDRTPAAARLVQDFVNTAERQTGADLTATPEELRDWFAGRRLMAVDARLRPSDFAAAITIREGLRAVLLEHAGHAADATAVGALNDALAELPVQLSFTAAGYRFEDASDTPFGRAIAQLADAIRESTEVGSWPRLKVCARDTCRWAFYDASRNQTRRWCSMAGCGNHIKMQRAYANKKTRERLSPTDAAGRLERGTAD